MASDLHFRTETRPGKRESAIKILVGDYVISPNFGSQNEILDMAAGPRKDSYWFVNRISKRREVQILLVNIFGHLSKGLGERTWFCLSRSPKDDCEFLSLKTTDSGVGNVPRTAVPTGRPSPRKFT